MAPSDNLPSSHDMSVIVLKVSAAARMGLVGYNLCVCL